MLRSSAQVVTASSKPGSIRRTKKVSSRSPRAKNSLPTIASSGAESSSVPRFPLLLDEQPNEQPTPIESASPSRGFESTSPSRRERALARIDARFPLELRLLHKIDFRPQDITAIYTKLAAMPYMLDDSLRDPFIFGQSICSTVTYLLGNPPVGIIWFPNLLPGYTSAIAGAVWARDGLCRWREARKALSVIAAVHKIHRFWSLTAAVNKPARSFNRRIGLVEEGTLRDGLCYDGKWEDTIVSGILKGEFS